MSALRAFSIAELLTLPKPQWLIEGFLPERGFLAIYGAPGDGKTFIALDLALCVATGTPWHGHPVRKSYVIYISAEGGAGIGKRVGAWLDAHGFGSADYDTILASFVLSTVAVHPDSEELAEIIRSTVYAPAYQAELAAYLDEDEDPPPPLIVVDTLARCLVGNENQQEDMGAFVRALDALREQHDATTMVLHHTGKDGASERGSTVLRGACDTMVKIEKSGDTITMSCDKQKDAEPFTDVDLELVPSEKWESCTLTTEDEREREEIARFAQLKQANPTLSMRELATLADVHHSTAYRWWKKVSHEKDEN